MTQSRAGELPASVEDWPERARDHLRERAGIVWANSEAAPDDVDRMAEILTRSWWRTLPARERGGPVLARS